MKENGPDEGVERPRDIALILLKSGLNMLPFGGSLASLLEFIPTTHQKNVEKAIGLFCQRLTDLEDRMDAKAVDKQEFAELFQTCARTMERTHREDKLRAAANILANLLLKPGDRAKVSYEELDHLIRCVDALSTGALSVLGAIRNITERHPLGPNVDAIQFQHLRAAFPKMSAAFLRSLVSELQGFHLATAQELGIRGSGEEEYDGSHVRLTPIGQDAHRTIHRKPHVSPLPGRPHLQNRVVVFFPSPAPHIMTFFRRLAAKNHKVYSEHSDKTLCTSGLYPERLSCALGGLSSFALLPVACIWTAWLFRWWSRGLESFEHWAHALRVRFSLPDPVRF